MTTKSSKRISILDPQSTPEPEPIRNPENLPEQVVIDLDNAREALHQGSVEMQSAWEKAKAYALGNPELTDIINSLHLGAVHWGWAMEQVGASDARAHQARADKALAQTTRRVDVVDVNDRHRAMVSNLQEAQRRRATPVIHNLMSAEMDEARASGFKLCLQGLGLYDPSQVPEDLRES